MKTISTFLAIVGATLTWSATVNAQAEEQVHDLPVVVLLGDSIRMNYQQTVVDELEGEATVWSPKENCRHTEFVLEQLEKWVQGRNASVIHINVGLHDLYLNAKTDKPRHSIDIYSANLRQIFARLKELTDAEIIFALTTPVDEQRQAASQGYKRVVRRNPDVVQYNRRAAEIAAEAGVRVNDIYSVATKADVDKVLRESDGIHLSKYGESVIGKHVANTILSVLRENESRNDETGFVSIFNGKDLAGWDSKPGAWEVRDGEIWCTGNSKEKSWLIWRDDQPSDFMLRLEFRWDNGNSGVQVRSDDLGEWQIHGYQVEVAKQSVMGLWHHSLLAKDHSKKEARHLMATAGQSTLLKVDGSKTVEQLHDPETVKAHFKEHAWNSMEIIAKGNTLTQKINGVVFSTVTDLDQEMRRSKGFIALQDHGKGCEVAFRNIRLKTLSKP